MISKKAHVSVLMFNDYCPKPLFRESIGAVCNRQPYLDDERGVHPVWHAAVGSIRPRRHGGLNEPSAFCLEKT